MKLNRNPFLCGVLACFLFLAFIPAIMTGCSQNPKPITHPGALNDFDSYAFDTLVTIQGALENARIRFAANDKAKVVLNKAIAAYDEAEAAYQVYHAVGQPDAVLQGKIQKAINDATAAIGDLQKQFGGK